MGYCSISGPRGKPAIPLPTSNLSFLQLYAMKSLLGVMMTLPQDILAQLRLMRSCGHATIGAICLVTYGIGAEAVVIVLCEKALTTATRCRFYPSQCKMHLNVWCAIFWAPYQPLLEETNSSVFGQIISPIGQNVALCLLLKLLSLLTSL